MLATILCYGKLQILTEPFDSVPFEIGEDAKIYVHATVNTDTIPLRFLIDTGSIDNVLNTNSPHSLWTLNQESLIGGESRTSTSNTSVSITPYDNSIVIGKTEFQGVRFILAPCAEEIDGIIGWNTLTGAEFLIDYDKQQIHFFDNGDCKIEDDSIWLPLAFVDGLPSIELDLIFEGESYKTNVWLDSGSDRCMDLSTPFVIEHELNGKQKSWGISEIVGMEGVGTGIEENFADQVRIGDYILYQVPLGLNISNTGAAANSNFGGVIGNNFLQRFNQIWSFSEKRFSLQPNHRMYAAPYKPMEGLLKNKVKLKIE